MLLLSVEFQHSSNLFFESIGVSNCLFSIPENSEYFKHVIKSCDTDLLGKQVIHQSRLSDIRPPANGYHATTLKRVICHLAAPARAALPGRRPARPCDG